MTYINGIGIISPQNTLPGSGFLEQAVEQNGDYLKAVEPVYRSYIDPIVSRRLSRLIKMGICTAKICMNEASLDMPDAIITGTGLGSVEDTEKILGELSKEEKFLNPTPFIQSTYNTISSQIAINLKCNGYNSTYVHRAFSLESALTDAILQIGEGMASNVLAGGIDEMTVNHLSIIRRLGWWKKEPFRNFDLWHTGPDGALAGEGAAYFLLSSAENKNSYCRLSRVETIFKPSFQTDSVEYVRTKLCGSGLETENADLLLMGSNGWSVHDKLCETIAGELFPETAKAYYKHLSGEYHTVSGFAIWLGAMILKTGTIPPALKTVGNLPSVIRKIVIHNHFMDTDHAFIVLERL